MPASASIAVNNQIIPTEDVRGVLFVPLVDFARAVGEKTDGTTFMGVEFKKEHLNAGKYKMLYAPYEKEGKLYVPLYTLIEIIGVPVIQTPKGMKVTTKGVIKSKDSSPRGVVDRYDFKNAMIFVYPNGLTIRNNRLYKSKMFFGLTRGNGCIETSFPVPARGPRGTVHSYLFFKDGYIKWSKMRQTGYKCGYEITILNNGNKIMGPVVPDYDYVVLVF